MYLNSDTLLLADVSENFKKMCLKIYHLDPVRFLSAPRLVRQAAFRKKLLMVEKDITSRICHVIYQNAKANNKYMKDYDHDTLKTKNPHILNIRM